MKPYSVLMLYPQDVWERPYWPLTYLAWVEADNVTQAIYVGRKQAAFAQSPRRPVSDFPHLMAIEGHHNDLNPGSPRSCPSHIFKGITDE